MISSCVYFVLLLLYYEDASDREAISTNFGIECTKIAVVGLMLCWVLAWRSELVSLWQRRVLQILTVLLFIEPFGFLHFVTNLGPIGFPQWYSVLYPVACVALLATLVRQFFARGKGVAQPPEIPPR